MALSNWSPYQIITGPAEVWLAATTTAFPAVNAAPAGAWTNLGQTEGGVTVRHTQNVELLTTDQYISALKAIRSEEGIEIEFSIAELTLENYDKMFASASGVTSAAGPPATKTIGLTRGVIPVLNALMVRGRSPYFAGPAQYEVPVVVQTDEPEVELVKDDKAVLHSTFTAMYDSTQPANQNHGRLVAQTS